MRRGSFDDAAASLRPVSIDPSSKGEKDAALQLFQTHESDTYTAASCSLVAVYEVEKGCAR